MKNWISLSIIHFPLSIMKLDPKTKLLMIGDSITDVGRARPVGEGRNDELGRGYVAFIDALLGAIYPQWHVRTINMGCGGNTVRDLKSRWQTDVLDMKPDWLSIMIGINDVWRQFDAPKQTERHVYADEYETTLRELVSQTRPTIRGLVLMTPFYIEPNVTDAMRMKMDQYGAIVKKIAAETDAVFVDTQAAFDESLKHQYAGNLAWDRVHPTATGHMILAMAFLKAIGFSS
jgi:lysophospholipase L1-like esterase